MFKALLKARLQSLASSMIKGNKKNSMMMKIGMTAIFLYAGICFLFMFGYLFSQFITPFHMLGIDWLYFTMMILMALALMIIGSIFMTQSQLYQAGDNELLLSMPIPTNMILFTRLLTIYLFNLLFEILVFLPGIAVYIYKVEMNMLGMLMAFVIALLLPLFSMTFSCIIGWMLELVTSRMRNKSIFTVVLSVAALAIYFYGYSKVSGYITLLTQNGEEIAGKVKRLALPFYWAGNCLAGNEIGNMIYVAVLFVLPFIGVYVVLDKTFIRMATTKRGFAKREYKEKTLRVNSIKMALTKKELLRFAGSPVYMLNTTLGSIVTVLMVVVLIVKREMLTGYMDIIFQMIPEGKESMGAVLAAALCAIATTNFVSAPSVSMEGKNLWILQSMPVEKKSILQAKLNLHMIITEPITLIAGVVMGILFQINAVSWLLILVLPFLFNLLCAILGLIINLYFPKLDWVSETAAVKQSISTMLAMLVCVLLVLIPGALYIGMLVDIIALQNFECILLCIYVVLSIAGYGYLMKQGIKILERL